MLPRRKRAFHGFKRLLIVCLYVFKCLVCCTHYARWLPYSFYVDNLEQNNTIRIITLHLLLLYIYKLINAWCTSHAYWVVLTPLIDSDAPASSTTPAKMWIKYCTSNTKKSRIGSLRWEHTSTRLAFECNSVKSLNPRQLNCTQKQCLLCERKRLKSPSTVRWATQATDWFHNPNLELV